MRLFACLDLIETVRLPGRFLKVLLTSLYNTRIIDEYGIDT